MYFVIPGFNPRHRERDGVLLCADYALWITDFTPGGVQKTVEVFEMYRRKKRAAK